MPVSPGSLLSRKLSSPAGTSGLDLTSFVPVVPSVGSCCSCHGLHVC